MYTKKEKKNKLVYIGAVTKVTALLLVRARPCSRKRTNKPPAMRVVEIALALCKKTPKFDIILKVRQPINISKGVSKWIIVVYHIHHGIVSII